MEVQRPWQRATRNFIRMLARAITRMENLEVLQLSVSPVAESVRNTSTIHPNLSVQGRRFMQMRFERRMDIMVRQRQHTE